MIVDCRHRDYDTTIIYYGYININKLDESEIRNHTWKSRDYKGRIPKDGVYCTPKEIQNRMSSTGGGNLNQINNRFGNVQYIRSGYFLYWIYCLRIDRIYKFSFVGDNVSPGIVEYLMQSNGFRLGYTHFVDDSDYVDLWYNPERLYITTFEYINGLLKDKKVYYKKFDSNKIVCNGYTACIFKSFKYINIPIMTEGEYEFVENEEEYLPWTRYIVMNGLDAMWDGKVHLYQEDFERDSALSQFSILNYREMLEMLFNKRV